MQYYNYQLNISWVSSIECLSKNQFEQFCINYANEKIQNLCTRCLIRSEQEWYKDEGIEVPEIEFPGNDEIIGEIFFAFLKIE